MASDAQGSLTFALDRNLGPNVLRILQLAKIDPVGRITSLEEMGIAGNTPDETWLGELGKLGKFVAVTRDGDILNAIVRPAAWRSSGVSLLLLDRKWGSLPLREIARTLLFWWPHMVAHARAGVAGTAWTVSHNMPHAPEGGIRLVTAPDP
jgi:hypothetical protein